MNLTFQNHMIYRHYYIDVMGSMNARINKSDLWNEMENNKTGPRSGFYYQVKDIFYKN